MTDSTTSAGWLRKSNLIEDGESPIQATIRLEVARLHALHYLQMGIREYSQWFRGVKNKVADALSRDDDRSDDELTIRNCSASQQNNFMADLAAASVATEEGVGGGTHENDTRVWARYTQYCDSVGIDRNCW